MKSVNTFGSLKPMLKETTSSKLEKPSNKKTLTKKQKFAKLKACFGK